jgi:hypothetical protein
LSGGLKVRGKQEREINWMCFGMPAALKLLRSFIRDTDEVGLFAHAKLQFLILYLKPSLVKHDLLE